MHYFGGVYVDQDIEFKRSMANMIQGPNPEKRGYRKNIFVKSPNAFKKVSNYVMACEPKSAFFWFVIQRLQGMANSIFHVKESFLLTMYIAGPAFLQKCINSYRESKGELTILEWWSFSTSKPNFFLGEISSDEKNEFDYAIGDHSFHASWGVPKKLKYDIFRIIVILLIIAIIVFVFIWLMKKTFRKKNFLSCRQTKEEEEGNDGKD